MEEIINGLKQIKTRVDSGTITTVNGTETLLSTQLAKMIESAINYTPCCKSDSELLKDKEVLDFDEWQIANYNLVNFGLYKSKETGDLDSKKGLLNKYCRYRENL